MNIVISPEYVIYWWELVILILVSLLGIFCQLIIENKSHVSIAELVYKVLGWFITGLGILIFIHAWMASNNLKNKKPVFVRTEIHRIVLTEIRPPKHVYVSFMDKSINYYYQSIFVAKHCNEWRNNQIGDEYNMKFNVYKRHDGTFYQEPINLDTVFCE